MLIDVKTENILFLDIETVPMFPKYEDTPEKIRLLWSKKASFLAGGNPEATPDELYERAGIYAEFGKIVCISAGFVCKENEKQLIRIKSFANDNEKPLLLEFANLLNTHYRKGNKILCAHNGKEFDYPYIARRMLVNGITLPNIINIAGKKPWEVQLLDTMELWKFGDYKSYTSLDLLTTIFDIPTPKDDIDGSQVSHVYWQEKGLERIVKYCQKDVVAIIQLFLKYQGKDLIEEENVQYL